MRTRFAVVVIFLCVASSRAAEVRSPSEFLGFQVGADRKLADYHQIVSYLKGLAAASPRVQIETLGKTTLGNEMVMAVISSEANMRNLPRIREIAAKLADPRGLGAAEIDSLVREGKSVVLVTCNIHSTEIGSSQMAMEWAHALATATDADTLRRLGDVVLLLVPSVNPDGQLMVTDWYRKYLGTKYEGGRLPWIYHAYVGHDDNRDWYMLTQIETRNLSHAIYHEWHPQLFVDEHQMGSDGPRMFIPPFADPVDPDVHPLIWRETNLIGANMAFRLEQQEKAGLIYGYEFDAYWLGGTRNTGWWKNITGLLLETASAKIATPVFIEPSELHGGSKGLVDYKATINHPNPWKGGWWRLRDIMDYERIASDALLEIASERRSDVLRDVSVRAASAVASARPREAYRIPHQQRDYPSARLVAALLAEHGVEVREEPSGDFWIEMAQPYGKFITEMLEPQHYPEVRLMPGKDILRPYDVATWTLPLAMGVTVEHTVMPAGTTAALRTDSEIRGAMPEALSLSSPESAHTINAALRRGERVSLDGANIVIGSGEKAEGRRQKAEVETSKGEGKRQKAEIEADKAGGEKRKEEIELLHAPRVGIYKPWTASIDEGWTRWVLETYGFEPKTLTTQEVRAAGGGSGGGGSGERAATLPGAAEAAAAPLGASLRSRFDSIILPDLEREEIASGRRRSDDGGMRYAEEMPPEYRGGLEKEGAKGLRDFVEAGGTLIAFAHSSDYVIDEFNIPVRNSLGRTRPEDFSVPGSLVRINVNGGHLVTAGMPAQAAAFIDAPIAFETTAPATDMQRWILASYPEESREILLSGWINGAEKLTHKAAAVAMTYGKGKIVLIGFRPQHRGQTHGTFSLIFNAIWWSVEKE
jgi:hypothetical protein